MVTDRPAVHQVHFPIGAKFTGPHRTGVEDEAFGAYAYFLPVSSHSRLTPLTLFLRHFAMFWVMWTKSRMI